MERSLYPSELAAPTMKPMEPHVASRTKYWAKLLIPRKKTGTLQILMILMIAFLTSAMLLLCYLFILFLAFCKFRKFRFPPDVVMEIMVWEPRLAETGRQAVRSRRSCFPFLFSQSFFKSPVQKEAKEAKEALVPRSATQLAKFTKHFFQLHFDHQRPEISINHTFELHDWTLQVAEVPAQDSTHHQYYGRTTQVKAVRFWVL